MHSERTRRATNSLLCAVGDPLAALEDVRPGDADFPRAQCIRIATAVIAKLPSALPRISDALGPLAHSRPAPVERLHLDAGEAWLAGDPLRAIDLYAEITEREPQDLLALRLAMSCCFFVGDHRRSCAIADSVRPRIRNRDPGHGHALALSSFAHAEIGDSEKAERLGREALEVDPSCPLGVHAVAHSMAEAGDSPGGAAWMRAQRAQWSVVSRMRTHNAWHLAMFDVDNERLDTAIGILDGCLLPAADRWPLDACDAAALLWRLTRAGVDVGARWRRLSDAFEATWQPGYWPYVDLHAAVAHGSAGQGERLQALKDIIASCAAGGGFAGIRARQLTQPALGALDAWLRGDATGASARIEALGGGLRAVGGSRAQIEVFVA